MFKDLMMVFWAIWAKLQTFESREIEKINSWVKVGNMGVCDTTELFDGEDREDGEGAVLNAKGFKALKEVEDRLDILYEAEEAIQMARKLAHDTAMEDKALVGSICPETMQDGLKAKSLSTMVENQISYWESVHWNMLKENDADVDEYTTCDYGYNMIHWGEVLRRGEKIVDWAHKCNDIKKLFDGLKRIDVLRNKRLMTYKHWIKVRYIVNVQIMRNATSENMKVKAMHFAIMSRVALAKKEAEDAKKEVKEREPAMVELGDVCGSYSINIEDALDKYHAAKKLADKNGVDCRTMQDMLDEEQELFPVESMLTKVADALSACDGVKAKAARMMGITIHKFNKLLTEAINVQKTYYNN